MPSFDEPIWGEGQRVDSDSSSICTTHLTPLIVTGIFVRLLESHFADPNNIRNAQLRDFLWADSAPNVDPLTTKINILPAYKYETRLIDQSPSIFVKRESVTANRISIQGKALTHRAKNGNYEGETYVRLLSGAHSILCYAKGGLNSEVLAEEVFFRLLEYTACIEDDLMFSDLDVAELSPPTKVQEDKDYFVTRVGLTWKQIYTWKLKPISPILKKVNVSAGL